MTSLSRRQFLELFGFLAIAGTSFKLGSKKIEGLFNRPKHNRFIAGVDFDSYKENVTIKLPNGEYKTVSIGSSSGIYSATMWAKGVYANLVSFIPYYPMEIRDKIEGYSNLIPEVLREKFGEELNKIDYTEYKIKLLGRGYEVVKSMLRDSDIRDKRYALFRIKDFPEYKKFPQEYPTYDFLEHLVENIGRATEEVFVKNSIVELELMPTGENVKRVNKICKRAKEIYSNILTAIHINDYKNAEKEVDYTKVLEDFQLDANIIIVNNYVSKQSDIRDDILKIKKKLKGKRVFLRILTGEIRRNHGFDGDEKDLESMLDMAYDIADGCIVSDANGAWIHVGERNPLDMGRRRASIMRKYLKFLQYEPEKNNSTMPDMGGMGT